MAEQYMNGIRIPMWMHKPKHKENVVATNKGWVVESTGEVLVSVKNLDERIKDFYERNKLPMEEAMNSIMETEKDNKPDTEPDKDEEPAKKKRGRPKGSGKKKTVKKKTAKRKPGRPKKKDNETKVDRG